MSKIGETLGRVAAILEMACRNAGWEPSVSNWISQPIGMVQAMQNPQVQRGLSTKGGYLDKRLGTLMDGIDNWPDNLGIMAHHADFWLGYYRERGSISAALRLLSLRRVVGMTQPQFAQAVGLSLSAVKQYESGATPADSSRAEAAERLLGTPA